MKRFIGLLVFACWVPLKGTENAPTRTYYNSVVGSGVTTTQGISSSKLNNSAAASAGLFNITQPGYYYLSDDIQPLAPSNSNPIILISANNVVLDLATKSIIAPTSNVNNVTAAIQIANGVSSVTIKNGIIQGIANTTTADGYGIVVNQSGAATVNNITLENITVTGCGNFGLWVKNCNNLVLNQVRCINNGPAVDAAPTAAPANFAGGAYFNTVKTATLIDCAFASNSWQSGVTPTTQVNIVGLYLDSSASIVAYNGLLDGNTNTTTFVTSAMLTAGLYLSNATNCQFTKVSVSNNSRSGANNGTAYGAYLTGTTGTYSSSNIFTHCIASNNTGVQTVAGMAFNASCNSNECINTVAELNSATATDATDTARAYGFYCIATAGNTFMNCRANNNTVPGSATLGIGKFRTAVGFYSAGSSSNRFEEGQANRNNISTATTTGAGAESFAAGFQLGDTGNLETSTQINKVTVNNNTTLGSATDARSYGIIILPSTGAAGAVSVGNIIQHCRVNNNTSANTAAARSYGIVDRTPGVVAGSGPGCTSLLRANICFGQGAVFSGGQTNSFSTSNMNYYVDFQTNQMKLSNGVKETNIANLNNVADINGYDLFNWSFTKS